MTPVKGSKPFESGRWRLTEKSLEADTRIQPFAHPLTESGLANNGKFSMVRGKLQEFFKLGQTTNRPLNQRGPLAFLASGMVGPMMAFPLWTWLIRKFSPAPNEAQAPPESILQQALTNLYAKYGTLRLSTLIYYAELYQEMVGYRGEIRTIQFQSHLVHRDGFLEYRDEWISSGYSPHKNRKKFILLETFAGKNYRHFPPIGAADIEVYRIHIRAKADDPFPDFSLRLASANRETAYQVHQQILKVYGETGSLKKTVEWMLQHSEWGKANLLKKEE